MQVGPVVVDAGRQSVSQSAPLADGRATRVVLDYDSEVAGVWSLQVSRATKCQLVHVPAGGSEESACRAPG